MLFPERLELEQDSNVQQAEEGDADTASDGGLKTRTSSWFNSADPDGPKWMSQLSARERGRHLFVPLRHANDHEHCPAQMAHPEILSFVVPREEGRPHALLIGYLGVNRFAVHFQSRTSSNEPLHCNKRPNRESQDEEDEQKYRHEAERQVLPHPAPASEMRFLDSA